MTAEITHLRVVGSGEGDHVPADRVLQHAQDAGLAYVLVTGRKADGEIYRASNTSVELCLLMLEQAKLILVADSMESDE